MRSDVGHPPTTTLSGGFDFSKNLPQYPTEFKAYMVTNSILNGEGKQGSYGECGDGNCVLGVSDKQAEKTINQLLANPKNGYGDWEINGLISDF